MLSTPTGGGEPDFGVLEPFVGRVLELLLPDTDLRLVNVNFPPKPTRLVWTCQAVRHYDSYVVPTHDPQGRKLSWLSVRAIEEVEEGSDLWAVRQGYVSITPLRLDLTDRSALVAARRRQPLEPADRR